MNAHSKQARPLSEQDQQEYDSTQRAVGAVVLFSLMMILYFILKAILGISETGVGYALNTPLEELPKIENNQTVDHAKADLFSNEFVFLNLSGRPMKNGEGLPVKKNYNNHAINNFEEQWYVQTASFKDKQAAEKMVKRLQANKFEAYVVKSGSWYAVRLQAQTDVKIARKQLRSLKKRLRISGILRHIKPD